MSRLRLGVGDDDGGGKSWREGKPRLEMALVMRLVRRMVGEELRGGKVSAGKGGGGGGCRVAIQSRMVGKELRGRKSRLEMAL